MISTLDKRPWKRTCQCFWINFVWNVRFEIISIYWIQCIMAYPLVKDPVSYSVHVKKCCRYITFLKFECVYFCSIKKILHPSLNVVNKHAELRVNSVLYFIDNFDIVWSEWEHSCLVFLKIFSVVSEFCFYDLVINIVMHQHISWSYSKIILFWAMLSIN